MTARLLLLPLSLVALPSFAQETITLADLQGAVMQASATNQRTLKRDGRPFPDRYETEWKIVFDAPETIEMTFSATSYTPRGTFKAPVETGRPQLERPGVIASRGSGHRIWIFDKGVLTFLRTFEVGGTRSEFSFVRAKGALSCNARVDWVREAGAPAIVLRSFVDNVRTEIYDAKQVASKCDVTLAGPKQSNKL